MDGSEISGRIVEDLLRELVEYSSSNKGSFDLIVLLSRFYHDIEKFDQEIPPNDETNLQMM